MGGLVIVAENNTHTIRLHSGCNTEFYEQRQRRSCLFGHVEGRYVWRRKGNVLPMTQAITELLERPL